MTEEKDSVVYSADENVKLLHTAVLYTSTRHGNVTQSDAGAQCFLNYCSVGSNYPEKDTVRPFVCAVYKKYCKLTRYYRCASAYLMDIKLFVVLWLVKSHWHASSVNVALCVTSRPFFTTRQQKLPFECH